jgi:hypothetical protein
MRAMGQKRLDRDSTSIISYSQEACYLHLVMLSMVILQGTLWRFGSMSLKAASLVNVR